MPAFDVARRWKGRVVLDRTGDKLGSVLDVFYDAENDEPGWVLLGTAGAGSGTRLVPVAEAVEHGNELRVPYDRAFVEAAPGMDPAGRLWPQEGPSSTPTTASTTPARPLSTWTRRTRTTTPWSPRSGACRPSSEPPRTPACGS
jgi:hypothetical protein